MRISLIFVLFTLCCYAQQPYTQDETRLIESGNINTALPIYQTIRISKKFCLPVPRMWIPGIR